MTFKSCSAKSNFDSQVVARKRTCAGIYLHSLGAYGLSHAQLNRSNAIVAIFIISDPSASLYYHSIKMNACASNVGESEPHCKVSLKKKL